jgi:hypothetical protein
MPGSGKPGAAGRQFCPRRRATHERLGLCLLRATARPRHHQIGRPDQAWHQRSRRSADASADVTRPARLAQSVGRVERRDWARTRQAAEAIEIYSLFWLAAHQEFQASSRPSQLPHQSLLDTFEQPRFIEGLGQKANRSGVHCLLSYPILRECGDENHRRSIAACDQVFLQLDATHAWHFDIGNQTGRVMQPGRYKVFPCRCERVCLKSHCPQQTYRRGAQRSVVVNNGYYCAFHAPNLCSPAPQTLVTPRYGRASAVR